MDELAKINRVIDRELPDASKEKLLVLDATTGQNAVNQAEQFRQATGITGIVLTKLDGTAKGGVVLAIKDGLGIPVKYIGVGEQIGVPGGGCGGRAGAPPGLSQRRTHRHHRLLTGAGRPGHRRHRHRGHQRCACGRGGGRHGPSAGQPGAEAL